MNNIKRINSKLVNKMLMSIMLIILSIMLVGNCFSAEFGVSVYGLSYHFERNNYLGNPYNENNYGGGMIVNYYTDSKKELFVEFGTFKDSFKHQSRYLSAGIKYKILPIVKIGAQLAVYSSKSVNGKIPIMTPVFSIFYRRISINAIYLPIRDKGDISSGALGAYANIILFKNL